MYVGHTDQDRQQPLSAHLNNVSRLAETFAAAFGMGELGKLSGLLHDAGKYSKEAQRRMLKDGPRVDHSTAGGHILYAFYGESNLFIPLIAYAILGHHAGLPNGGSSKADTGDMPTLYGRLKKRALPNYEAYKDELLLPEVGWPEFHPLEQIGYGFSLSFLARMLYSCLVDADYLDTEAFMQDGAVDRGGFATIEELFLRLQEDLKKFENPQSEINKKRTAILKNCLAAATAPKGLYTLTVPTGGGKTIASLAFALKHARTHGMERVIYVIPYNSIIEQNAEIMGKILGEENVLEHHSGILFENEEGGASKKHLATENWDCPVVVTTNVQFFESLFADRSSKCRKLHNIANSVIIFDEAQMLPQIYLKACTKAIAELVRQYGCTAVLCTATQSALDRFFPPQISCTEICEDPRALYTFFQRTEILQLGQQSTEALAKRLNGAQQVLCIVNTKRQAQALYGLLQGEGRYHLSTSMYPLHRRRILDTIRERLSAGLPCKVVSTSLVEAGVDLDFPVVYREKAGLDSIIQAAGRCNREGKRPKEESPVYVFSFEDAKKPPPDLGQTTAAYDAVFPAHKTDIASLDAIRAYFTQLYVIKGDGLDAKQLLPRLEKGWSACSFPFKEIAKEFQLIEEVTYSILIPVEEEGKSILRQLRAGQYNRTLLRRAALYSVNVRKHPLEQLLQLGMAELLDAEAGNGFFVLTDPNGYTEEIGLKLEAEAGFAITV
ncbi:CRISPR-associated helicase Cas3' [Eubacteriales bacterium OttesenSCG-928-K08]|nr:CRISPR-associated helicase Cas3' [Eubacteriales bacterium OttesenSCG-928-K08]